MEVKWNKSQHVKIKQAADLKKGRFFIQLFPF